MPATVALPAHRVEVQVAAVVQALAEAPDPLAVEPVVQVAGRAAEQTNAADDRPSSAALHCSYFTSV
jgi:hypothetical protein